MSEPNATLENLASLVADVCGTTCVAVWSCALGGIELRYSKGISQRHINAAQSVWHGNRTELQAGRSTRYRDFMFLPVRGAHGGLVGIVALSGPATRSDAGAACVDELLGFMCRHLERPEPLPEPEFITVPLSVLAQPDGMAALVRMGYERLMNHFGWNISLVAALLHVPRQTLSARLKSAKVHRTTPSSKARAPKTGPRRSRSLDDAVVGLVWANSAAGRK